MTATLDLLPTSETHAPATPDDLAQVVRQAHDARQPLYPVGGGTSLDFGLVPQRAGAALATSGLAHVVDYTPRDMTIISAAGLTVAALRETLAAERQHLPIDTPRADEATVGGLVACDWSGPRRYGYGTLRDYVIGIRAVDGRGVPFKAGGRVVKNVAGYDFMKLLTGSLGTLGVITEVTFKVKPVPEQAATVVVGCESLDAAEAILAGLVDFPAVPAAVDLLVGSGWSELGSTTLAVRLEGSEPEVAWMTGAVQQLMTDAGGTHARVLDSATADKLFAAQVEFSDRGLSDAGDGSPLTVKLTCLPSRVTGMIAELLTVDPGCTLQAHAASGVLVARFSEFNPADLTKTLIGRLRPAAVRAGGGLTVLASQFEGLTAQVVWGGRTEASPLAESVKAQFDPHNILNPGRFIFG